MSKAIEPGSVVIMDSTGLKVYGKNEWHQAKHAIPARRTRRKLHLAIDEKHHVSACELTTPEVGDTTAVPDLLAQIPTPFDTFVGDGAYDGEPTSQAVLNKQPNAQIVIPPHKTAVYSATGNTQRNQHINVIARQGRTTWQRITGYIIRNYVDQRVCTKQNDQSGYAGLCKMLKIANRDNFLPKFCFIQQRPCQLKKSISFYSGILNSDGYIYPISNSHTEIRQCR